MHKLPNLAYSNYKVITLAVNNPDTLVIGEAVTTDLNGDIVRYKDNMTAPIGRVISVDGYGMADVVLDGSSIGQLFTPFKQTVEEEIEEEEADEVCQHDFVSKDGKDTDLPFLCKDCDERLQFHPLDERAQQQPKERVLRAATKNGLNGRVDSLSRALMIPPKRL